MLPVSAPLPVEGFQVLPQLLARAAQYSAASRDSALRLLPAELVSSFVVSVPKSSPRQRAALITYAIEDRIAAPIETVLVVQGPLRSQTTGEVLAFVVARDVLAGFDNLDAPLLPEFLMIPPPDATDGPCWLVWREGARIVVRCSDGTGFAASAQTFPTLWKHAGKPALRAYGDPLGGDLPAQVLTDAPPPPAPADLTFSFARTRKPGTSGIGLWRMAAAVVAAALVLHLVLSAVDTMALRRVVDAERTKAALAIAEPLPGISLDGDINAILIRLSPKPASTAGGRFLPLLNDVTGALADAGTAVTFRRLAWGAEENSLVLQVQGSKLEDLQTVQQTLESRRFAVRSGAANAGDGGAEVEMRISREADQ